MLKIKSLNVFSFENTLFGAFFRLKPATHLAILYACSRNWVVVTRVVSCEISERLELETLTIVRRARPEKCVGRNF